VNIYFFYLSIIIPYHFLLIMYFIKCYTGAPIRQFFMNKFFKQKIEKFLFCFFIYFLFFYVLLWLNFHDILELTYHEIFYHEFYVFENST
jgi:hypothetical protein